MKDFVLSELRDSVATKRRDESLLKKYKKQYTELEKKERILRSHMDKELWDVEQLEGKSFTAFLYRVIGKREEKLDSEQAEAAIAVEKHRMVADELRLVASEISKTEAELASLSDVEERYSDALKEKIDKIKSTGSLSADEVIAAEEEAVGLASEIKELDEARNVAKRAKTAAKSALDKLSTAEGYGTWDVLGGGIIAELGKQNALNEAESSLEELQKLLGRLKAELSDVRIDADFELPTDGFTAFADYFFDNIFVNWSVLDSIENSHSKVEGVCKSIDELIKKLSDALTLKERQRLEAEERLAELLISVEI